jgi:outer membrane usher protein FimD/PapC
MDPLARIPVCAIALALVSGCAGGPSPEADEVTLAKAMAEAKIAPEHSSKLPAIALEEKPVDVRADRISPEYSSINARVLNESSIVDSNFAASLDSRVQTVTRLESSWTQQRDGTTEAWRVGDTVSSSGLWGSSVRYGGVQFGTRFDVRRDVIASTRLASNGMAVLPSVADALFASAGAAHPVMSGQNMSIDGGVNIAGPNALNFVARDAFGRAQNITAPLMASTQLVTGGCDDFSFGMGKVRRDYAVASNDYGPLFANTTVVCGAPLGFTIEGHGEYLSDEVTAFGFGVSRRLGVLGTASVALASSRADTGSGWLARFGFDHENSLFNVMVRTRTQSRDFREVGTAGVADPIMERGLASLGMKVSERSNLAVTYATQTTWERERVNLIGLSQNMQVGRGSLSMSAGHSLVAADGSSVFISFSRPIGLVTPIRASASNSIEPMLMEGAGVD